MGPGQNGGQTQDPSAESTQSIFPDCSGPSSLQPDPQPPATHSAQALTAGKVILHQASVALVVAFPLV